MPPADPRKRDPPVEFVMKGFVLRTPLLPVTSVFDLKENASIDWQREEEFSAATAAIRERMRELLALPEVAEALFLASPVLVNSLPAWLENRGAEDAKRIERTLVSYLTRMATRPTPFGLFAGCSVGRMGEATRLELEGRDSYRRSSRLDMDYLFSLTEAVNRNAELRRNLLYRPNDSMVRLGERFRYVEPRVSGGNMRRYHWVAAPATPYLECVLQRCGSGARVDELAHALVQYDSEITEEEALEYLDELIDEHVLVSTLQPPLTGLEAAADIAGQLRRFGQERMAGHLDRANGELARLDAAGPGRPDSEYFAIVDLLKALPAPVEVSRLVQVDMLKPGELVLGPKVREEVERCASLVVQFASSFDRLAGFKTAFDARYGTAAVPLLQALDPETGISLEETGSVDLSPLLAGLPFLRFGAEESAPWKPRHGLLLNKLGQVWKDGATELVLQERDLEMLYERKDPQTSTVAFHVSCSLLAASSEAADAGDFQLFFSGASGPGGARTLGRFADIDTEIDDLVREHLREEESVTKGVVFAEIVHLPQGRLGNVIRRPVFRDYELVYMGRSGAPPERQIPLSDVLVTVRGNTIRIWSARTGKRIIPRLTNAHNFSQPGTLAPYRFLALLQGEGIRVGFSWDWGPLSVAAFLPRVRYGKIILARCSWALTPLEISEFSKGTRQERFLAARSLAARRGLPRLVSLLDGENDFVVDFDNPLSVDAFISQTKRRNGVRLSEIPALPEGLCVEGEGRPFTHELHIPIVRKIKDTSAASQTSAVAEPEPLSVREEAVRSFAPGSEWLFVKIYAGGSVVDRILGDTVRPLASNAVAANLLDRWFFVRYRDPEPHIRLRFRGDAGALHGRMLPMLQQALAASLKEGSVSRIMLDTYQPEVERYGGNAGLELSERIFQADSEAIVELLSLLDGDDSVEARWQLALLGVDYLIDDFGFDPSEKRAIIARRRKEFGLEFKAESTGLKHGLGDRYRQQREALAAAWSSYGDADHDLAPGHAIWRSRSEKLKPFSLSLRAAEERGQLLTPVSVLIDSYLHMSINRIFRSDNREHELVIFDFLDRHYRSVDARARKER